MRDTTLTMIARAAESVGAHATRITDQCADVIVTANGRPPLLLDTIGRHDHRQDTHMTITVLTRPDCPQCRATIRRLDRLGAAYTTREIEPDDIADARAAGIASAPIVQVHGSDGTVTAQWGGYRPDLIASEIAGGGDAA